MSFIRFTLPVVLEHQLHFTIADRTELKERGMKEVMLFFNQNHLSLCYFHADLNELNYSVRHRCLAEFLQVLHNIRGLQPDADSSVKGVGRQLVLVDVGRSADGLRYGYQEILGVLIHWREGFQENVAIGGLAEEQETWEECKQPLRYCIEVNKNVHVSPPRVAVRHGHPSFASGTGSLWPRTRPV